MRSSLLFTIILMGLLTVGFTIFTGGVYLQQTLDNRQQIFTEVVELEVHNLWDSLKDETQALGLSVQSEKRFRQAFEQNSQVKIEEALNESFHRAYVTLNILNLKKIILYNKEMQKVYQSSEGEQVDSNVCESIVEKAKLRTGAARLKTIHQVCSYKDGIRLVTLVPIGGLLIKGYLSVVVDPVINLSKAEQGLGIPVMIKNVKDDLLYVSENWPEQYDLKNIMLVHYGNRAGNETAVAHFYFANDVTELQDSLFKARMSLISFVVAVTLAVMMIALGLFRKTILTPLDKITGYLNKVRLDKKYLNTDLEINGGSKELVNLANEMNGMSRELGRLYHELEEMAFTDSLTGIPNRALLFDRLSQMTLIAGRDKTEAEFMLMMMDLNLFKSVNDSLGHHVGDKLLVAVAARLQKALRVSDTVARIGGDEFAMILYAVNDKGVATAVADKITALMSELFEIDGYELDVGMSIGIARFPDDGKNSEELLHKADVAMYHAKRSEQPYVFYEAEMEKG